MMVSLIAALTVNHRVIGRENVIPWRLPADLVWFKNHTINKPVIMGRKTFVSIGMPLPDRLNIVLSRQHRQRNDPNVIWVTTPTQALKVAGKVDEIMVIGGGKVYETLFMQAKRLYLTYINAEVNGDTWFPNFDSNKWRSTFIEFHDTSKKNAHSYHFEILDRR